MNSKRDEKIKILVNSCITGLGRILVNKRGKSSAAFLREEGRHAISKFWRAVSMEIKTELDRDATMLQGLGGRK